MRVPVTGAAGNIGSVVAEQLVEQDHSVLCTDTSSQRIREELGWQPRYPDLQSMVETGWAWRLAYPKGYGG
jgi:UDP-glucose 4-epimerase